MLFQKEGVVISGISGQFPQCETIEEFSKSLYEGLDMVTEVTTRWNPKTYRIPARMGQLKDMSRFDADFFSVHGKQAHNMDPRLRILLELCHEALIDAGVNPTELSGSSTGVYVGATGEEALSNTVHDNEDPSGYIVSGGELSTLANRISFHFNLQGPSMVIDTACSSSLIALQQALVAIRSGVCDSAVVAGAQIYLNPMTTLAFTNLGLTGPDGKCKAFDASANGYVRGEAAVVLYVCKGSLARRSYATILHALTNTDGNKTQGFTFPSGKVQERLLRQVYAEAGIDPSQVGYFEAHGTGTKAGDKEELEAVARVFSEGRDPDKEPPLLIGSVKSNMGHAEPGAGLCGIAKLVLIAKTGVIPGNLHFVTPNPDIPPLLDGTLEVVGRNKEFRGDLVAISSFGFGGANAHAVLKLTPRGSGSPDLPPIPLIFPFSGRTVEVGASLEKLVQERKSLQELASLLHGVARANIPKHHFRSYAILNSQDPTTEVVLKTEQHEAKERPPLWFIFSGMGAQYKDMFRDMVKFKVFRATIKKLASILESNGFDLKEIMRAERDHFHENVLNSSVSLIALQMALIDLLGSVGILPDKFFGHSLGEVACAYSDKCLTAEQTILIVLFRGRACGPAIPGAMASIGLSWEEAGRRLPAGVYLACNNSPVNVTVTGSVEGIEAFVQELKSEGIFARSVSSAGMAFHCSHMRPAEGLMREMFGGIIPKPVPRSDRWISTSEEETVTTSSGDTDGKKYLSVEYLLDNVMKPVRFLEALRLIPEGAVTLEIAPHCLLQPVLKQSLPQTVVNIGAMKRTVPNNCHFFLEALGQLYLCGFNPDFGRMYDPVRGPVGPETPMISPVVSWDHSQTWTVAVKKKQLWTPTTFKIDIQSEESSFYEGHVIDDRTIFPATGYMYLAWCNFARNHGLELEDCPVTFENIRFFRSTSLLVDGGVEFLVQIFPNSGDFQVSESNETVCSGKISSLDPSSIRHPSPGGNTTAPYSKDGEPFLDAESFYKELSLRGYSFQGHFRQVQRVDFAARWGEVKWCGNWVPFLDSVLQTIALEQPGRYMRLPIRVQKLVLNPRRLLDSLGESNFVPVSYSSNFKTISAPGVEVSGFKVARVSRKRNQELPLFLRQSFVPYVEDTILGSEEVFELCSQIAMDNSPGFQFTLMEFGGAFCSSKVVDKFGIFPECNIILVTDAKDLPESLGALGVNAIPSTAVVEYNGKANFVISNLSELKVAEKCLAKNGFLLLKHPEGGTDPISLSEHELTVAQRTGFTLFRRKPVLPSTSLVPIEVNDEDFQWLNALKSQLESPSSFPRVYLWSRSSSSGLQGLTQSLLREGYNQVRTFHIQDGGAWFDLKSPTEDLKNVLDLDLIFNVHCNGRWGCHSNFSLSNSEFRKPQKSNEAFVNILRPGDLSTLQWIESPLGIALEGENKDHLIDVHYSALNFRDVMLAVGKLSREALPGDLAHRECVLGVEFSGKLRSNGRSVFGYKSGECLSTTVDTKGDGCIWEVPDGWSLAEAATVPVAYSTAYYALVMRGRLKEGETVLIHAGSGGVGQAAIAVALSKNCRVITTVSSQKKRRHLMERFPSLTEESFTDSRDSREFEEHVMNLTEGRGVDIVLNSLAGEKLIASVRCLARRGRFLEIGKVDLFNNSNLGMEIFLKSVDVQGILHEEILHGSEEESLLKRMVQAGMDTRVVQPLNYDLFSRDEVEEAFRFMAAGKHMGKVLINVNNSGDKVHPEGSTILALPRTYFYQHKAYVVLGGLGGMGLEVCNWMVSRGAKNLVLGSRNGARTKLQKFFIESWEKQGVRVLVDKSDATTEEGAHGLLRNALSLGPVGGIFNLAVVLRIGMIMNQTSEDFAIACEGKILATKYMDRAARKLEAQPDLFVAFSSIEANMGTAGQSNYTLANAYMERVCEQRRADGLHGLAIQWGAVGEVGVLHNLNEGKDLNLGRIAPQSIASILEVLDAFLRREEKDAVLTCFLPVSRGSEGKTPGGGSSSGPTLRGIVARILGIRDLSSVNPKTSLLDLGMDSLMSTQIKEIIEVKGNVNILSSNVGNLSFNDLEGIENNKSSSAEVPGAAEAKRPDVPTLLHKYTELNPFPREALIKMNSKGLKDVNLFIVHDGMAEVRSLQGLVQDFEPRVYGLECSKETPMDSIPEMASFYIQEVKRVQDRGPYALAGYSYGATVAFEMALELEGNGEAVDPLILFDGAPKFPIVYADTYFKHYNFENQELDTKLLLSFAGFYIPSHAKEAREEILSVATQELRLRKLVEFLQKIFTSLSLSEIEELVQAFTRRIKAAYTYKAPPAKLKAVPTLVRAGVAYAVLLGPDYSLNEVCENGVKVVEIDGHHLSFRETPEELLGVPSIVNSLFP